VQRAIPLLALLAIGLILYAAWRRVAPVPAPDWARLEAQARAFCAERGLSYPLQQPSLRIEKGARRLTLLEQGAVVAQFPIALGSAPSGHKQREGDLRTPEGDYFVCEKHVSRRF
jgi:hypothetical protein